MLKLLYSVQIVIGILLISHFSFAQDKGFTIEGYLEGIKNGTKILLLNFEPGKTNVDTVLMATVQHGAFRLKGKVLGDAQFYALGMDSAILKEAGVPKKPSDAFVLTNVAVTVRGKLVEWPKLHVAGSAPHDEYEGAKLISTVNKRAYNDIRVQYTGQLSTLWKHYQAALAKGDSVTARAYKHQYETTSNEHRAASALQDSLQDSLYVDYIQKHLGSLYIPQLISVMQSRLGHARTKALYEHLSPVAKHSFFGKKLQKEMQWEQKKELVKKGAIVPDFKVVTPNGGALSILEVASMSKYTLIDFWASWCKPCRAQIPHMKKAYAAFHNKGFNILGISTDRSALDWKKALSEDAAPWLQGRDSLENAASNIFNIKGIPAFILIDQTGRIIHSDIPVPGGIIMAEDDLRGAALYTRIAQLLKEQPQSSL